MEERDFSSEVYKHRHIVLCGDNINSLSIIRSLGEKGIRPVVIMLDENHYPLVKKTRYACEVIVTRSMEESFRILLSYGDKQCPPFIHTSDDNHQNMLDLQYERLKDSFYFFNAGEAGRVTRYMNKWEICQAAKECGFTVANGEAVAVGELPKSVNYPVITKTLNPFEYGWKRDVGIYYSPEELSDAYKRMVSKTLLVQEYVEKENEIFMQGFSVDGGRIVYIPFKGTFTRLKNATYGSCCSYNTYQDDDLIRKIEKLFRMIGFSGNFEIEFLVGKDGNLYFLEINFRYSLFNHGCSFGGVNLPFEWAKATLSHSVGNLAPSRSHFIALYEPKDFAEFVVTGEIGFVRWIFEILKADTYCLFDRRDVRPAISFWKTKILRKLKKREFNQ